MLVLMRKQVEELIAHAWAECPNEVCVQGEMRGMELVVL